MPSTSPAFQARYGPWAVVAGASEGLGAAFAAELAGRGLHLLLIARRGQVLESVAAPLREAHGVEVRTAALDLTSPTMTSDVQALLEGLDVGLLVYNAAYAPVGALVERSEEELRRLVSLNVMGPLLLARRMAPRLIERGRGGVLLMSSLAGNQGTPRLTAYAASKAFNTVLAEGLWGELRAQGVDVVGCTAGAIRTPGYDQAEGGADAPGTLDASDVAVAALNGLGQGPRAIPGWVNRLATFFMGRVLPRTQAIAIMDRSTRSLT